MQDRRDGPLGRRASRGHGRRNDRRGERVAEPYAFQYRDDCTVRVAFALALAFRRPEPNSQTDADTDGDVHGAARLRRPDLYEPARARRQSTFRYDTDYNGHFQVQLAWNPGINGFRILEGTSAGGPLTVVQTSAFAAGPCTNNFSFGFDPLSGHRFEQARTYYFEIETIASSGAVGPPSNIIALTIPNYNGDSGSVGISGSGNVRVGWTNPLQGYRIYLSHSPSGPFSLYNDSLFQIDTESVAFSFSTSAPSGTQECFEIQGYDPSGNLGPIGTPACYTVP